MSSNAQSASVGCGITTETYHAESLKHEVRILGLIEEIGTVGEPRFNVSSCSDPDVSGGLRKKHAPQVSRDSAELKYVFGKEVRCDLQPNQVQAVIVASLA